MKNIHLINQEKYNDSLKFEKISEGIYKALVEYEHVDIGNFVTTFSFTLEKELNETDDMQYPLEDLLDMYLAHVSEFIKYEVNNPEMILELCIQGSLAKIQELIKITGKHVYNKEIVEEGQSYFSLVIE